MRIEFIVGPSLTLTRNQAIALLEVLQEQLPRMATPNPTQPNLT